MEFLLLMICSIFQDSNPIIWCAVSGEPAKYADFVERWHRYCHKVSTLVKKDEEGMAINLLSTTLATRNMVST